MPESTRRDRSSVFVDQASERLPAVVYSLDIADFKRRNGHLGHAVGDADIAELHALLLGLGPSALVARTHGDRWLVLAPEEAREDVASVLARFARTEPLLAGWQVRATKDGRERTSRETEPTFIMRAVRCLFAPVRTRAELEDAVRRIDEEDHALPVNRPIAVAVAARERKPWQCVSRYPEASPACPFCGGREVDWEEGDGGVYSGAGTCRPCGARLALDDVSRRLDEAAAPDGAPAEPRPPAPPFARNGLLEDLGYRAIVPVAHSRIAIAEEGGRRQLVSVLRDFIPLAHAALDERAPWDLPLVGVRRAWASEEAPAVLAERLPRGFPSTWLEAQASVPPFVVSLAAQLADAHAEGRVVGALHPALVFVDDRGALVGCAQRPLRAEGALFTASRASATSCGTAPMFFDRYLTPREVGGRPGDDDASDDVFRLAAMIWRWRRRACPFGNDGIGRLQNTMNGTPVHGPAD
ncbi:MAG TPA: diguanylate cyclase, partial [Labilithrix sp.]|nr:diguanylate cyclase [Labilithrix sp.]